MNSPQRVADGAIPGATDARGRLRTSLLVAVSSIAAFLVLLFAVEGALRMIDADYLQQVLHEAPRR